MQKEVLKYIPAFKRKKLVVFVAPVVKNLPANALDIRDRGSIPGSGRSPGGGYGNSLKFSWLQNPMERGT